MKISLAPETIERIRAVLGHDVDLAPDVVPSVLARLAVEAPATYSQVLEELSGSQIRLDSEQELRRRRRRSMLRRVLFSWGEYETGVGDRLLEKRHIAAAVPLAIAVLTMALLAFSLVVGHRVVPTARPRALIQSAARGFVPPASRIPRLVVPRPEAITPDEGMGGPRRASVRYPDRAALPMLPVPALPPVPPGLAVSDVRTVNGRGLGNPVVVSLQAPSARETRGLGEPGAGVPSSVVYNRATEPGAAHEAANPSVDPAASKVVGSSSGPRGAGGPAPSLLPGTRLAATLLTGAIVVPGGPAVPVVVETADPHGIWTGQAVLGPADRVQVTLTLATPNRTDGMKGVALEPERLLVGLPGRTTVRHSSSAAAMATAALQAASDYAQAAARQGSISVYDGLGPVVVGGQVPEAWTYLAARLAQEFQARRTPGGWVTMTEVPAGTALVILVTGGS